MAEKIKKIIEEIESLTVVELNELIKSLEEKFGVSGIIMASPMASSQVKEEAPKGDEKVDLVLTDPGANKINVIKVIREINPNLSLKDAKDITDNPPQKVAEKIDRAKAEELRKKFETAGAKVELK